MSDFQVDRSALRSAAGAYDRCADTMNSIASTIREPDPMMMGIFLQPLVQFFGPMVTDGARSLLTGVGRMNASYGQNLRATADSYQAAEEYAKSASADMTVVD
jgi:hypothetical protein